MVPVLLGTNAGSVHALQNCTIAESQVFQTPAEKALLDLINNYRTQNSVAPLTANTSLNRAAAWMSNDMAANNRFSHTDTAGRDPGARLRDCGYNWMSYAENIYPNSTSPQAVFDGWKNSPPHNANMLSADYKEIGIAQENNFWTLDLGSSSSSGVSPTIPQGSVTPTFGISPTLTPTPSPTPTPTPTPSIIVNPTDTKITLSIRLLGIGQGGNTSPKHLTRQVVVVLYNVENRPVTFGNGFLKYNGKDAFEGTLHLGQLPNGTYYVKVVALNTLVSLIVPQFQTIQHDKPNVLPQIMLTSGDYDQNNVIDIEDFNVALSCFQTKSCPTKEGVDVNDDGQTNVIDYNLFLSSFRRSEGD